MILDVEKINTYYGTSHVLFDVSLHVREGEVVALMGRNGAGKTTTIRSIMGTTAPRDGKVRFQGAEVARMRPYLIARRGMAIVPAGRRIFASLTVLENLEIAQKPGTSGRIEWTAEKIFRLFPKLREMQDQRGGTLSGGEQQMLAVGRALMGNPDFLLLDEPAEGLSPLVVSTLLAHLLDLKKAGLAMLLCEQNAMFALRVADRGYVLDKGMVKFEGTSAELGSSAAVRSHLAL
ncbi:MAG TPA: ABC transporter ATP-binding protein [Myxococcales bacterium]|nr:ABC transporter ATP-binding protein [Myxococcales bacterium]